MVTIKCMHCYSNVLVSAVMDAYFTEKILEDSHEQVFNMTRADLPPSKPPTSCYHSIWRSDVSCALVGKQASTFPSSPDPANAPANVETF